MRTIYVTTLDRNYLARGLCLYRSLVNEHDSKAVAFYCMDKDSYEILQSLNLSNVSVVHYREIETPALEQVRKDRRRAEYCWTIKPAILQHAMGLESSVEWAVYVDSDMMFFGDPNLALRENVRAHVVLSPHRFSEDYQHFEPTVGRFNAGYCAVRNSDPGRKVSQWWLDKNVARCSSDPTPDAYGDQKYLDSMQESFEEVLASPLKGLNAAPWNIGNYRVTKRDGRVFVDNEQLLVYHFQGLHVLGRHFFDLYTGDVKVPGDVREYIYRPYLDGLIEAHDRICTVCPGFRQRYQGKGIDYWVYQLKRLLKGTTNLTYA